MKSVCLASIFMPQSSGTKRSASCCAFWNSGVILNGSISVARAGCSLRSGWPSHSAGVRMRRRLEWPSKPMPNMSNASRSYQFATGYTDSMESRLSPSFKATLMRTSSSPDSEIKW